MATQRELVEQLFEAALGLKPEERAAFLDGKCDGNAELRQQVESLLADANAHSPFEQPTEDASSTPRDKSTTVIGPYHLLELIGEGGMGEVWLAEQKQPVRRRVAIKLIKAGMDTHEVVARFESERQALALMDHPAIAKVFDAGSTPEGRPYFVMEFVPGVPITDYCDKHRLTVRQRMELFIQVCEGVQHAHQKAIIHRDLKPSNILVAEIDGKPMPRIIDFGVAKATSQKLSAGTMYTRVGTLIGTIGYMSPEQADPIGDDIDIRTDVYSLGAVLYELLTGARPLDLDKLAYDEVLRRLRDQDALRPSTKVTTLGGDSAIAAKNRGSDPPTLVRQLRGDPDAIALKAIEKHRARRYASASELGADIGRYLRNEPVTAHTPSVAYRAQKYIRRHRLGVAVAGIAVLLLVAFVVVQSIELRRISQERDRATRERDRADRIAQFMTGIFKVSDPSNARGNTVTAREILDRASSGIDTGLRNDPELQAKMMYTMAQTYLGLGLFSRAKQLLERTVEIQKRVLGPRNPETLRSISLLAGDVSPGHYAEAEKVLRDTIDTQRRILGPDHADTLDSTSILSNLLTNEGHLAEAEKLLRETLEARRRVLGPENSDTLNSMASLGSFLVTEGHYAEAEKLFRQTLEIQSRLLGPDSPDTLSSMKDLGFTLMQEAHYAEAEKLFRQTLDIQNRVLGQEHPDTLYSMNYLGLALTEEGHYAEAEKLCRQTLDIENRVLGPENSAILNSLECLAAAITREGRYDDAKKLFREDIERMGKSNENGQVYVSWYNFACAAAIAGRHEEAIEYLRQAIDHGFAFPEQMDADPDLKSLHRDPRFEALVAKARQSANAQPH